MCADFCNNDYDDAVEYGFDVISVLEQRSITELNNRTIEELPDGLVRGKVLCLTASSLINCQRWAVNLLCGKASTSDIAFHFNPRLLQHFIVRNARVKGQWGNEEIGIFGKFNIKHGEEFKLKIYATDEKYFVTYNGKHICSYNFRVPPNNVTHIEIGGMVDVYRIFMENFDKYPDDQSNLYIVKEIERTLIDTNKQEVPVLSVLSEGLESDWQLEIYATPKILPQMFSIDLRENPQLWPLCSIPLYLKANFGNNMLVRNAFVDNKWGMEERIGGFKFLPSIPFTLWIRKSVRKFSIWINEKLQVEFAHRCDSDIIKAVYVEGDVYVNGIYINKNPEKYF